MEIFLNIIPQHFIRTEIRGIIKHIQTFGAALKTFEISKIAISIVIIVILQQLRFCKRLINRCNIGASIQSPIKQPRRSPQQKQSTIKGF